jgi:predicted esterase
MKRLKILFYSTILILTIGCQCAFAQIHIYYLHGKINEEQGRNAVSEKFGKFELDEILKQLNVNNSVIHCEIRTKDTDVKIYATKISREIDSLINSGIPPRNITIVGASKGAIIAMNISNTNKHNINYVFLAGNNDYQEKNNDWKFHGQILCIYDLSDDIAGKNYNYWKEKPNYSTIFEQLEIKTNLGHGFLYKPLKEWINPTKEWIKNQSLSK